MSAYRVVVSLAHLSPLQRRRRAVAVKARMMVSVPVDTGRLRRSQYVAVYGDGTMVVAATAPYAGFVHQGTRRMHARPWMLDALRAERLGPYIVSREFVAGSRPTMRRAA
jgi:hypothetical protein